MLEAFSLSPLRLGGEIDALADALPRWSCLSVARLAVTKPRLITLDLTGCRVGEASAAAQMTTNLPETLEVLTVSGGINQPDAMLYSLLAGVEALPRLREVRAPADGETRASRALAPEVRPALRAARPARCPD